MEISEVKVFPIQEEKLKAFVSIVFDQCFMVNDIKIIQGRDGLFISMPSRKKKNGEFKDVAHPLNNETRRMIEDRVLGEYERVLGERGERLPAPPHHASAAALALAPTIPTIPALAAIPVTPENLAGDPPAAAAPAMAAASAAAPGDGAPGTDGAGTAGGGDREAAGITVPAPGVPEKTLEEIEEMHLRDSFWTVT